MLTNLSSFNIFNCVARGFRVACKVYENICRPMAYRMRKGCQIQTHLKYRHHFKPEPNGDPLQQIAQGLTGSVSSARPGQGTGVWADVTAETGETQEGSGSDNTTQMLTPQTRDNTQIRCTHGACFIRISPLSYSLLLLLSGLSFYDEHELSLFLSKAL